MSHTGSVSRRSEDSNLIVWRSEGLHSFVSLLTVIQAGRQAMYPQERISNKFRLAPLFGLNTVMRLDVTVYYRQVINPRSSSPQIK